jgi:hypothetical protein
MTMDPTQPAAPATSPAPAPGAPSAPTAPVAPVAPVMAVAPRAKSGGVLNLLLVGAAILAVGGVAFAIGRSTAPASTFPLVGSIDGGPIRPAGSFAPGAGGPRGLVSTGGLAIDGTVTAVDADSLTLTLDNGDEMTFALDGDTTYHQATDATPADVAIGDDVSVKVDGGSRITSASDGSGGSTTPDLTAGDVTVSR